MNSESARLQSFNLWSVPSNVCFRNLAKNGFYATGNLLEVECNWCHCRINEWNVLVNEYNEVSVRFPVSYLLL